MMALHHLSSNDEKYRLNFPLLVVINSRDERFVNRFDCNVSALDTALQPMISAGLCSSLRADVPGPENIEKSEVVISTIQVGEGVVRGAVNVPLSSNQSIKLSSFLLPFSPSRNTGL